MFRALNFRLGLLSGVVATLLTGVTVQDSLAQAPAKKRYRIKPVQATVANKNAVEIASQPSAFARRSAVAAFAKKPSSLKQELVRKGVVRGDEVAESALLNVVVTSELTADQANALRGKLAGQNFVVTEEAVFRVRPSASPAQAVAGARTAAGSAFGPGWNIARIKADQVWGSSTGKGVVVAVVDSGVLRHQLFKDRLLNGITILTGTYNLIDSTDPTDTNDNVGHGTHVAGIIAAVNTLGPAPLGGAPGAKILPVKVMQRTVLENGEVTGTGSEIDIQNGVLYAISNHANVINLSLGEILSGETDVAKWNDCLTLAKNSDVTVVVAAGNSRGQALPGSITVPGASPLVVTVGATDEQDAPAAFSNLGPTDSFSPGNPILKPDVSAPGTHIRSAFISQKHYESGSDPADPGDGLFDLDGTSMATPLVASTVALLLEVNPHLTVDEIRGLLKRTADSSTARDNVTGAGVIDALAAVTAVTGSVDPLPRQPLNTPNAVQKRLQSRIDYWAAKGYAPLD